MILSMLLACVRPECQPSDYGKAECRVQAENSFARGLFSDGIEVRFQDPRATETDSWAPFGLVRLDEDDVVQVRVAGLGDFRISVHRNDSARDTLPLRVHNVHPAVPPLPGEVTRDGLARLLEVPLDADVVEITGGLPPAFCGDAFRVASVGDVQTNPLQFQRLIDALHEEVALGAAMGEPLVGLVLLGDLAEDGTRQELQEVDRILRSSPVPTAAVPGNHDIYSDFDAVFNEQYGPGNHTFDVCGLHATLLDTGSGGIAPSIQGRLPQMLDTEQRFQIAAMHHPPYAATTTDGWTREDQAQHLLVEMAARDADMVLAGHAHRRRERTFDTVRQVTVGTAGASQLGINPDYGYARLRFTDEMSVCFVPVPAPGLVDVRNGEPANCPESE